MKLLSGSHTTEVGGSGKRGYRLERWGCLAALSVLASCAKSVNPTTSGSSCSLTENTAESGQVHSGCALVERDTSSCEAERLAQGLSGAWLKFSCRVSLSKSGATVLVTTDSQPDYKSNYFASTNACYTEYTPSFPDPGTIGVKNIRMSIPASPGGSGSAMSLGPIGVAVNGVTIFDNQAAPGDDIYQEAYSFDPCQGHPAGTTYHYHSEPYAISYDDSKLIGVLRDGYFLYGRRDGDGSLPTLDATGGHTGVTPDSPATPVYHYHVNAQSNGMETQWFLTTGVYKGAPGTCQGCQN